MTSDASMQQYFSLQNLNELAGIDRHLEFAQQLTARLTEENTGSTFPAMDLRAARKQLAAVQDRKNDPGLNLSVIGEFSTGKSTFINALLREELLASSALQGTTTASTVMEYDHDFRIRLRYRSGVEESMLYDSLQDLKTALHAFTTQSDPASGLEEVRVGLPAGIPDTALRIIDTPGTNVTEAWHEEVTIRTLEGTSDLSVVLISATRPVPDTLLTFLRANLKSILPQCVFVVTFLDTLRPRERTQMLAYIRTRLETELDIENAVVLPYAAPQVLARAKEGADEADHDLLSASYETEQALLAHTKRLRALAVSRKLLAWMDQVYQSISASLDSMLDDCRQRLDRISRSRKADLHDFLAQEQLKRLSGFDASIHDLLRSFDDTVSEKADRAAESILHTLDNKSNLDAIKAYIGSPLSADCQKAASELIRHTDACCDQIRMNFNKQIGAFSLSFMSMYEELDILPVDLTRSDYALPDPVRLDPADLSEAEGFISEKLLLENMTFLGSAAAGAAIGSIIPGVGTIVGGIAGFIAGAFLSPDTDTVRAQCQDKLKPQLSRYFASVISRMISACERFASDIRRCLDSEFSSYEARYRTEVEDMIAQQQKLQDRISARIHELDRDRMEIMQHRKLLDSTVLQLDRIGRRNTDDACRP